MRALARAILLAGCAALLYALTQPLDSVWRIIAYVLVVVGGSLVVAIEGVSRGTG